ncbi:MAG: hypothetical protein LUD00_01115 [Prevotellaceae bacterium]|nr:hypothetical protein [Prevotellaceae bacterium]
MIPFLRMIKIKRKKTGEILTKQKKTNNFAVLNTEKYTFHDEKCALRQKSEHVKYSKCKNNKNTIETVKTKKETLQ